MRALIAFLLASLSTASFAVNTITSVVGYTPGSGTENVPAISANLDAPGSLVFDAAGNYYFMESSARVRKVSAAGILTTHAVVAGTGLAIDAGGNIYVAAGTRIHRIDPAGNVTVFAGNGTAGFSGDGGPATSASLNGAVQIAIDDAGNLLITDTDNYRIRKVAGGVITTVAGTGVSASTGNDGPASQAQLLKPVGVVRDGSGGYYIWEQGGPNSIRHVLANGVITSFSTVVATFTGEIARDAAGNLYAGTGISPMIVKVTPAGLTSFIAGVFANAGSLAENIPATQANIGYVPKGLAVSPAGELWISDTGNNRIRKIGIDGLINTMAGVSSSGSSCPANGTAAMSVRMLGNKLAVSPSGEVTISDASAGCVFRIAGGIVARIAGGGSGGDGGAANAASLSQPGPIAYAPSGDLYISENGIRKVDQATGLISTLRPLAGNESAVALAVAPTGRLYVGASNRVLRVESSGAVTHVAGSGGFGTVTPEEGIPAVLAPISVFGLAFDAEGNLLIADGARIRRVSSDGSIVTIAGTGNSLGALGDGGPAASASIGYGQIAADADGRIYLADTDRHRIRVIGRDGIIDTLAGTGTDGTTGDGGPATAAQVSQPRSIAWDENTRSLYVFTDDTPQLSTPPDGRVRKIAVADDPVPGAFTFPSKTGVALSTVTQSDAVTPTGFNVAAAVTVADGEHSVGCTGTFTAAAGTLQPGQSLCLRHASASASNADRTTTVTVGGRQATFTSQTLAGPGSVQVSGTSLDFGFQSMRIPSTPRIVTLTNNGAVSISVNAVRPSGGYATTHDCATLAAGATCTVNVVFTPIVEGSVPGTLILQASPGTHSVTLAGVGERSFVTHYYRTILGREPDAAGKTFWNDEAARIVAAGADINEAWFAMAIQFFFSPEYTALNRTNDGFTSDLYRAFLAREPDGGGLAYWSGQLGSGMPREVLLAQFTFSPEFNRFTAVAFGNSGNRRPEIDMVMDFYRGLLSRLPDNAGLATWLQRFRAAQCNSSPFTKVRDEAEAISSEFVSSPEYTARNRTNTQFVGDLYNGFLRRGGDLPGVQHWISQLATGALTRDALKQKFVASTEFGIRVQRVAFTTCLP